MLLAEVLQLPASEIEFWREYYDIYPFPQERSDARAALIAQTISNMSGRVLKDTHMRELDDFLPTYGMSVQEIEERFIRKQIEREMRMGAKFMESKQ